MTSIEPRLITSFCTPFHSKPNNWSMNTPFQWDDKTVATDNAKILFIKTRLTQYPAFGEIKGINHNKISNTLNFYYIDITRSLSQQHTDGYQLPDLPPIEISPCYECDHTDESCPWCFGTGTCEITNPRFAQIGNTQFDIRQLYVIRQLPDVKVYYPSHERLNFYGPGYIGSCFGVRPEKYLNNPLYITL